MKKIIVPRRFSLTKLALLALAPLALPQSALGVVTVHFVETGPDLVVSFNGTLSMSPTGQSVNPGAAQINGGTTGCCGSAVLARIGTPFDVAAGTATSNPFNAVTVFLPLPGDVGFFGFNSQFVFFESSHVSGGVIGAVTELTVTPATASFTFPGASLMSINADGLAEGALLWTENTTGDTFVFSRFAPVPEPSSVLLCGLSAIGLMRRRRQVIPSP